MTRSQRGTPTPIRTGTALKRDRRIYDSIWWRLDQVENPVVAGWKDKLWKDLYGEAAWWEAMAATEPLFKKAVAEGLTLAQHTDNSPWSPPPQGKAWGKGKGGGKGKGQGKGKGKGKGR